MADEYIWQGELDARYECTVTRTSERAGHLLMRDKDTGEMLVDQAVSLSYGAPFGPDVADEYDWIAICERAVDGTEEDA